MCPESENDHVHGSNAVAVKYGGKRLHQDGVSSVGIGHHNIFVTTLCTYWETTGVICVEVAYQQLTDVQDSFRADWYSSLAALRIYNVDASET